MAPEHEYKRKLAEERAELVVRLRTERGQLVEYDGRGMGKVASRDTPAGELIWKRLYQEVEDSLRERPRYPNRSAFVAADTRDFETVRDRYLAQGMTVVVVYPDDSEEILHPPPATA